MRKPEMRRSRGNDSNEGCRLGEHRIAGANSAVCGISERVPARKARLTLRMTLALPRLPPLAGARRRLVPRADEYSRPRELLPVCATVCPTAGHTGGLGRQS